LSIINGMLCKFKLGCEEKTVTLVWGRLNGWLVELAALGLVKISKHNMGFNENKFRRLRKFRFFGRAKVYLLVRWPHLVRCCCSSFISKLIPQFAAQLCQYISLYLPFVPGNVYSPLSLSVSLSLSLSLSTSALWKAKDPSVIVTQVAVVSWAWQSTASGSAAY